MTVTIEDLIALRDKLGAYVPEIPRYILPDGTVGTWAELQNHIEQRQP